MSSFTNILNNKIIPVIMKFVSLKAVIALKDGLIYSLPLTLIGSVFLLLANIPYKPVADFISSRGWDEPMNQAYGATFGIMAIVCCIGIAYTYVKNEGYEPLSPGMVAFSIFVLTTNSYVKNADGSIISNVIPKEWTAGQGMVTAIIIGLLTGFVYTWFMKHDIKIKMPAGVPEGVMNAFSALIPGAVLIIFGTIIYILFKVIGNTTLVEFIYRVIQIPLQGVTDSLGGVIVMGFMVPFLWWFGIHGSTIIGGLMAPILQANTLDNGAIVAAGKELTLANGAHIVTQQFLDQFMTVTGAGMTIGLVLAMVFIGKSTQSKELGKLTLVPAIFNINEPVLFGTPIVMNPFMAIPFICMPMISGLILYFSIYTGLIPPFGGVLVPWTTPPIISGFLVGGWKTALLQAAILALSFFVYLPFFKKVDKMNLENEKNIQAS